MTRQDFRFFHSLRVRWAEVDMQKIVFNAHYLMYFDTAISDYWRVLAIPYEEAMQRLGGDLYVKIASLEFHGSACFDDQLNVGLKCSRVGNSSITFKGAIFRERDVLVTSERVYVFADPVSRKPRTVPSGLRTVLLAFEQGTSMRSIKVGNWAELGPDAARLRVEVFVGEQRIPIAMEWDDADAGALHAVAYNGLGQPVATGRLLTQAPRISKIGRMAVKKVLRGAHLGHDVLQALMHAAKERGDTQVTLHAQRSAQGFYERAGFTPSGEPFDEVDIPHIEMIKTL